MRIAEPGAIREKLIEAVYKDLLGPAGGPEEEVTESSVRDRYLVGMLAPKRKILAPEEFDELGTSGDEPDPQDGVADFTAPQSTTMFPSSFGMTFCVDASAAALRIAAGWGQYDRVHSETIKNEKTGAPSLVWKRRQIDGTTDMPLTEGPIRKWVVDSEFPDVTVSGIVRKREAGWIVTLFLVNGRKEPDKLRDSAWMFQAELAVESPDGEPIFRKRAMSLEPGRMDPATFEELRQMEMLYRDTVEFAVGHGVGVHAEQPEDQSDRAFRISTRAAPAYELPQTVPPTDKDIPAMAGVVLDMKQLAEADDHAAKLMPLVTAYEEWIEERAREAADGARGLDAYEKPAGDSLDLCRKAARRIRAGLDLLAGDETAAEAFRFMNRAMWQQRVRTIYSDSVRQKKKADEAEIDVPANRTWYPFQMAFILISLPGLTDLHHPDRTHATDATADLLWYPTGGGKTEAYLGLAAYTMALRRLQGTVAGRSGEDGVAVLMRYTLRLLTVQQFQRASTLICACEMIRREAVENGDTRWGTKLFRLGLWVGMRTTPNTTDQSAEAVKNKHGRYGRSTPAAGRGSPAQLTNCPWCGVEIDPGKHIKVEIFSKGRGRTLIFCGDDMGQCPFSAKKAPGEGLPVLVVDEEIYRRLPSMLIATVDKFAQMPWKGETQMLFGQVNGVCERHGFRSPDIDDSDSHPAKGGLPRARTVACGPLRPPDLIIQDELHLISGPLGTLVGIYEAAIDRLASWEVDGSLVRPKVIASTATIRRAPDQVHQLFLRKVDIFPPPGLEARDNFFARQAEPSEETPGRLYIGICAPGRRLKVALIRVYTAFMSAGQQLYEKHGAPVDPWMTLVGYFNSLRELAGMRRLVDDDVRTRLTRMDLRGLATRKLSSVQELTSRVGSTQIPEILDRLGVGFDPSAKRRRPIDVLLATNMVSVGVDVQRLGLMVVAGQPKTTAEYIQATSRVGRKFPGVVCTVFNWARPRDLSHYETFEHYHASFYKHVEALSVTPFAARARDRGLTGAMVSCIRLIDEEFNANTAAGSIDRNHPILQEAMRVLVDRAQSVTADVSVGEDVRQQINERFDGWLAKAQDRSGGKQLGYRDARDGVTKGLIRKPGAERWDNFTCPNSLRDVQQNVGLIFDDHGLDAEPEEPAGEATESEPGDNT